ncbi:MAG: protein kinase [Anaerolineae bacterium]|nr:protein kinase [Anaerolineae bacterium]
MIQSSTLQNRYRVLRQLGGGGMGTVYLAEDTRLAGHLCAIKELSPANLPATERNWAIQAFRQEAAMLANLQHPGLTAVTDFFPEEGNWYLVMDFVDGETLETTLERAPGGRLPLNDALDITRQLCEVLDYLHKQDPPVVFRDLKPGNIMLNSQRQVKLIDFGIARHFKPGKTGDTVNLGTPGYAAPEQYGGIGQSGPQTDVYSLGAVLLQMVSGYNPTAATTPFPLPAPGSLTRGLPHHIEQAIVRATQLQPQMRYANVREFQQALQGYGGGTPPINNHTVAMPNAGPYPYPYPYPVPQPGPVPQPQKSPNVLLIVGLGFLAILCLASGAFGFDYVRKLSANGPAETSATIDAPRTVENTMAPTNTPQATPARPTAEPTETRSTATPTPTEPPTSAVTALQWSSIGSSVQRRELSLAKVGYSGRTAVVVVGSIQGDQVSTRDAVNSLITRTNNDKGAIPAGTMFYFIPSINPDGNASNSRYNANGVDLNRNWDTADWRSNAAVPGYPDGKTGAGGRSPFSEPETQALRDLLRQLQSSDLKVIVFHSSVSSPNEIYSAGRNSDAMASTVASILGYSVEASWGAYTPTGEVLTWCGEQGIRAVDIVIPQKGVSSLDRMFQTLIAVAEY